MTKVLLTTVIAAASAASVWAQAPEECATMPSGDDVIQSGFELSDTLLDLNLAGSVGILAANVSGSGADKLAVKQWAASVPCISRDGKWRNHYGLKVMIGAAVNSTAFKGNISFSLIAAQASLSAVRTNLDFVMVGLKNDAVLADLTQLITEDLRADTYPDFVKTFGKIATDLAAKDKDGKFLTESHPQLLSREPVVVDDNGLFSAVGVAEGLSEIAVDGHTCNQALTRGTGYFTDPGSVSQRAAITSVYRTVVGACDDTKITDLFKERAKRYLFTLKVRQ
ncbi:MAG: hypothetical protein JO323_02000 [Acidobacteriia bacterium]|nr:hypothetical protein [Terriglobia bacterium]